MQPGGCREALLDAKSAGYERVNRITWSETGWSRTDLHSTSKLVSLASKSLVESRAGMLRPSIRS